MPSLGADMERGTVVEWQVAAGDRVHRGQVVAVIETDKGAMDVEIWHDGVVKELLVPAGSTVPVGALLATLRAPEEAAPVVTVAAPVVTAAAPPVTSAAPVVTPAAPPTPAAVLPPPAAAPPPPAAPTQRPPRASPAARRVAHERGVDLHALTGSGPSGAILLADVEKAAGAPAVAPAPALTMPPAPAPSPPSPAAAPGDGMRRAIAAAMARSKREIPHYYLAHDIDVAAALAWLEHHNRDLPAAERVLPIAVLLRAVAVALAGFPELHGHHQDGRYQPGPVHLGVAISLRGGGLVAPAIHDAERLAIPELMRALTDLIQRARTGHLRGSEITDPTVTVTSLGERGVDTVFGVIYPPQVAIVGLGAIRERPYASNGLLGVRPVMTATLAGDHRVSDGHRGALFLAQLAELLGRKEMP